MYCPTCGKQTPDNSAFCLHCGSKIDNASVGKTTDWEYKEFVWGYKQHYSQPPSAQIGDGGYTIPGAKLFFWQETQKKILVDLQKELDNGWTPITEVGPSAIQIDDKFSVFDFVTSIVIDAASGNSSSNEKWCEPIEFRVQLRRPRQQLMASEPRQISIKPNQVNLQSGSIEQPKKSNTGLIIGVAAVVFMCGCCIILAIIWQYGGLIIQNLGS